tara:strand:- start:774 stop:1025 length:252 start_codon:yes stop_codon:yes gene_type:complete
MDLKNYIFGLKISKKFKIGDLVSWKSLGKKEKKYFGVIIEIFTRESGGRSISYSRIVRFSDSRTVTIPIISLKLASERKKYEI